MKNFGNNINLQKILYFGVFALYQIYYIHVHVFVSTALWSKARENQE